MISLRFMGRSSAVRVMAVLLVALAGALGIFCGGDAAQAGVWIGGGDVGGIGGSGGGGGGGSGSNCSGAGWRTEPECNGYSWIFYRSKVSASEAADVYFAPEYGKGNYEQHSAVISKECAEHGENGGFWHLGVNAVGSGGDGFGAMDIDTVKDPFIINGNSYYYATGNGKYGHMNTLKLGQIPEWIKYNTEAKGGTPMTLNNSLYYNGVLYYEAETIAGSNEEVFEYFKEAYVAVNGKTDENILKDKFQETWGFCYWDELNEPAEPDHYVQSTASAKEVNETEWGISVNSGVQGEAPVNDSTKATGGFLGYGWNYGNSIYLKPLEKAQVKFQHRILATANNTKPFWEMEMLNFHGKGGGVDDSYCYGDCVNNEKNAKVPYSSRFLSNQQAVFGETIYDIEGRKYYIGMSDGGNGIGHGTEEGNGRNDWTLSDGYIMQFKMAQYRRRFCEQIRIKNSEGVYKPYTSVCTGIIVPYSFENTGTVKMKDGDKAQAYAGEKISVDVDVTVSPKNTNTNVGGKYATQVDNPRYALVTYVSGSDESGDLSKIRTVGNAVSETSSDRAGNSTFRGDALCNGLQDCNSSVIVPGASENSTYSDLANSPSEIKASYYAWNIGDNGTNTWTRTGDQLPMMTTEQVNNGSVIKYEQLSVDVPDKAGYFCVSVAVYPYVSNPNNAGNIGKKDDNTYPRSNEGTMQWYVSSPTCTRIMKKPLFQVLGSTIFAGEGSKIYANLATKKPYNSGIAKTFGSWAEQGIVSNGLVNNMASGATLANGNESDNYCNNLVPLSVANGGERKGNEICIGTSKATGNAGAAASSEPLADLMDALGKVGRARKFNNNTDGKYEISPDVADKINKAADDDNIIQYVVADTINIGCDVTSLKAVLIAEDIYTAAGNTECGKELIIKGAVEVSDELALERTFGAGIGEKSAIPAEIINFDNRLLAGYDTGALEVVSQQELPPRY